MRRYASAGWRLDRARGGPLGGDPGRRLLLAVFAADERPTTSRRQIFIVA
jgi:hypothetical protein